MTCSDKVFVNSHTVFPLTILAGFAVGDIVDLNVTLTSGTESVTKTLGGGGVAINGTDITLEIDVGDITVPGVYALTILLTDTNADLSRISPCPETIKFYE